MRRRLPGFTPDKATYRAFDLHYAPAEHHTGGMTEQKPVPKYHHYVPRMLLKRFTDENGWIYELDNRSFEFRKSRIDGVGGQTHFNTIIQPDGSYDQKAEVMLAELEGLTDPLIEKILRNESLSHDEEHTFALFLAAQMTRVPAFRNDTAELASELVQQFGGWLHDNNFEMTADTLAAGVSQIGSAHAAALEAAWKGEKATTFEYPKSASVDSIFHAANFAEHFLELNRVLAVASKPRMCISDNPIVRRTDPKTHSPLGGNGGLKNPSLHVTLPISSRHVLLLHREYPAKQTTIQLSERQIKAYATEQIVNATSAIYVCSEYPRLTNHFRRVAGSNHPPRVQASRERHRPKIKLQRR